MRKTWKKDPISRTQQSSRLNSREVTALRQFQYSSSIPRATFEGSLPASASFFIPKSRSIYTLNADPRKTSLKHPDFISKLQTSPESNLSNSIYNFWYWFNNSSFNLSSHNIHGFGWKFEWSCLFYLLERGGGSQYPEFIPE